VNYIFNIPKSNLRLAAIVSISIGCCFAQVKIAQATEKHHDAIVRIEKHGDSDTVEGGKSYDYTITPKVSGRGNCKSARNVTVTEKIPAFLQYESSGLKPSKIDRHQDGSTTLVWHLGDVATNQKTSPIKYRVKAKVDRERAESTIEKTTIDSDDDRTSALAERSHQSKLAYKPCQKDLQSPPAVNRPNVLLVKRISAINTDRFTTVFNPNTTIASDLNNHDGNPLWPANYIQGGGVIDEHVSPADPVRANKIKPGDEVEYTIYFLNAGNRGAKKVRICDLLTPNQTYVPGVTLAIGDNISTNGDNIKYIPAGGAIPANCGIKDGKNVNGLVVVDVTSHCTIEILPSGIKEHDRSYGYVRFRTKVN
jgi:uncharacterized repeat protein (TIGR01451 family)